jgi:rhodanese-related sulfurtransferase
LWLPYNASEKDVQAAIPSKDSLVIVYCSSLACPASKSLADRLVAEGYTNVYKYPEGLQEWMRKGFPVHKK